MLPRLNAIFYNFTLLTPDVKYIVTAESESAARMLLPLWDREKAALVETSRADECKPGATVIRLKKGESNADD